MRRSLLLTLFSLPLVGPGCGLFAGPNYMRTRGDAPFTLDKVVSALFTGQVDTWDDHGYAERYGSGELLLISDDVSCDEFRSSSMWDEDSPLWSSSGVVADLRFSVRTDSGVLPGDGSWEGQYWSGVEVDSFSDGVWTSRWMYSGIFAEGTVFELEYSRAVAEVTDYSSDQVEGTIESSLFVARFQAENCGEEQHQYGDDTGHWGDDSGWDMEQILGGMP